jgi:hypothetical protein
MHDVLRTAIDDQPHELGARASLLEVAGIKLFVADLANLLAFRSLGTVSFVIGR